MRWRIAVVDDDGAICADLVSQGEALGRETPGNRLTKQSPGVILLGLGGGTMLQKPKMILFDYGQTLADEKGFDGLAGSRAILAYAVENKHNVTAEELQAEATALNREVGRL